MAISSAVLAIAGLAMGIVFLSIALKVNVDPREPPVVHPRLPFLGHIVGMLREGPMYLKRVR